MPFREPIAVREIKEFQRIAGDRGTFESVWDEIARRIDPIHVSTFTNRGIQTTKGAQHTDDIFDSTAALSLDRFASILDSMLTPATQIWHRLKASDPTLNRIRSVKLWFEEVNRILFKERYAPNANFAAQNLKVYRSLGAYGTAAMFIDEIFGVPGLRYKSVHLGELYIQENHQGIVDRAWRQFPLEARQAIQRWGDRVPERIRTVAKTHPEREFLFLHCVKPREDFDPERRDHKGMPFVAYYISIEGQSVLEEKGFNTFPYAVPRYKQANNEAYGRSVAMDVLPAIKTLNEEKKTVLKQGHRSVDPILLAHDDGVADSFSFRPGAINFGGVSADGKELIKTLPVGNIAIGKDLMDDERAVIKDAFLVTLFQILVENPQMTATEVIERTREKGMLLAPTAGGLQSGYLSLQMDREIDVLSRQGKLPPMPQALLDARGEYSIVYDSPMSRAQRAEEAAGIMRTVESALSIVNITQNPEPLDHFNWDVIIPQIADIQGVPASWMRSIDSVLEIRQGRMKQQQTQEMIQAGPSAAAMIKASAVAQKGA